VDILKNARQPMLAVCLSDTVRRVRAHIQNSKKQSRPAARVIRAAKRGKTASLNRLDPGGGGHMIGELGFLERVDPGADAARVRYSSWKMPARSGKKEDPYWAVLPALPAGTLGLVTRKQVARPSGRDLRF